MGIWRRIGTYVGGAVSLAGLALAASFVGRRTADPVASNVFGPLSLWMQVVGVLAGLLVVAVGLRIVGLVGKYTESEEGRTQ